MRWEPNNIFWCSPEFPMKKSHVVLLISVINNLPVDFGGLVASSVTSFVFFFSMALASLGKKMNTLSEENNQLKSVYCLCCILISSSRLLRAKKKKKAPTTSAALNYWLYYHLDFERRGMGCDSDFIKHLLRRTIASSIFFAFLSALIKWVWWILAIIRETEGWRIGAITNQLYVGRAWSGSDSFTAPVILMEWTVLHRMALQPFPHQMYGNQGSL